MASIASDQHKTITGDCEEKTASEPTNQQQLFLIVRLFSYPHEDGTVCNGPVWMSKQQISDICIAHHIPVPHDISNIDVNVANKIAQWHIRETFPIVYFGVGNMMSYEACPNTILFDDGTSITSIERG